MESNTAYDTDMLPLQIQYEAYTDMMPRGVALLARREGVEIGSVQ